MDDADEASAPRIPPHDLDAERALLGSLLIGGSEVVLRIGIILKPDDFYRSAHAAIYSACVRLNARAEPVDIVTVGAQLEKDGLVERIGGRGYLADVSGAVPTAGNAEHYARIIREKAQLRAVIEVANELLDSGYDPGAVASELLGKAQREILMATQARKMSQFIRVDEVMRETMTRWDAVQRGEAVTGLLTGYPLLDEVIGGMWKGDLIALAARPSIGKTSLAVNIATNVAQRGDMGVAIFSLEMTREQLFERMYASEARIPTEKLRRGELTDPEVDRYGRTMTAIAQWPIFIDDDPVLDETMLLAKAQRVVSQFADTATPIGLIVLDYLQRMKGMPKHRGDKRLEVAGISGALKDVARQLEVPVMALSQLTREVDKRPDKRPMLSDLMESGAIEADSDVVLFIHRPSFYWPGKEEYANKAEIIVAKQRRGPAPESVWLGFNKPLTRFYNREGS